MLLLWASKSSPEAVRVHLTAGSFQDQKPCPPEHHSRPSCFLSSHGLSVFPRLHPPFLLCPEAIRAASYLAPQPRGLQGPQTLPKGLPSAQNLAWQELPHYCVEHLLRFTLAAVPSVKKALPHLVYLANVQCPLRPSLTSTLSLSPPQPRQAEEGAQSPLKAIHLLLSPHPIPLSVPKP